MATNPVTLTFKRSACSASKADVTGIPCQYGIYYVAALNSATNKLRNIYVGQSDNLNTRLSGHERYDDFVDNLQQNESLVIHTTTVASNIIDRIEQALIYKLKPPLNDKHKSNFDHQDTTITITGSIKFPTFTV